jgi:hypothetical protein
VGHANVGKGDNAVAKSVRIGATDEVPVAMLGQPSGALQVAFPSGARPFGLSFGVLAQDDPRRLCPICTLGVGIEKPQICDQVVFVVILALGSRRTAPCRRPEARAVVGTFWSR